MSDPGEPVRPRFNPFGQRSWNDLGPRFVSAIVLLAIALAGLIVGGYLFSAVVGAAFAGCYREWDRMVTLRPVDLVGGVLIGLIALSALLYTALGPVVSAAWIGVAALIALLTTKGEARGWRVAGVLFYGLTVLALLSLRGEAHWGSPGVFDYGLWAGAFLGIVIWSTDIGAYFTGRQVGGEKLAPDISPGKTWSGAIGGLALGTLAGLVLWLAIVPQSPWWIGLALALGTSIVGQIGDLSESALKRRFRVKDSGDIIPGHGGLMDRLDSLSFGVLFVCAIGLLHAGPAAVATGLLVW